MKLKEVERVLNARVVCGDKDLDREIGFAFSSDLMSDVLTLKSNNLLLVTGLANVQTIRTAEMSDISNIIFVRNKKVTEEMIRLAKENQIVLLECEYSMFKTSGLLYQAGIRPLY
jgi:predicted transcriptional regulator